MRLVIFKHDSPVWLHSDLHVQTYNGTAGSVCTLATPQGRLTCAELMHQAQLNVRTLNQHFCLLCYSLADFKG